VSATVGPGAGVYDRRLRCYSAGMQRESIKGRVWQLETDLLHSPIRRDPAALLNLLAEDFCEFGSSGRIYTRDDVVKSLQMESPRRFSVSDSSVTLLGNGVALRYQAHQSGQGQETSTSLRSSLWVLRDSRWQMLFHQGTRVGPSIKPAGGAWASSTQVTS
jgi:hypothetical protein